jgi:DnaJ-class molecular chaperone
MICPTCHGEHYLVLPYAQHGLVMAVVPCPDCGGHGRVHCCDGQRAQPDEKPVHRRKVAETSKRKGAK